MATNSSVFAGFEEVAEMQGGTQLVYGVNVLQIEAEVQTQTQGLTVSELVERYRKALNLPADVVVFVDGVKYDMGATVPPAAERIEIVKPAGVKGSDFSETLTIPLMDEDSAEIVIAAEDTVLCQVAQAHPRGKMEFSLLDRVDLRGMEVLSVSRRYAVVGYRDMNLRATRKHLRPVARISRRVVGGVAKTKSLDGAIVAKVLDALRMEFNEEPSARVLHAGDILRVVVGGERITVDCTAIARRAAEIAELGWTRLRLLGAKRGVKVAGKGRTSDAIRSDLLRAEFPEILGDAEDAFVMTWLYPES